MFNFKNRLLQRSEPLAENSGLVELQSHELGCVNGGGASLQVIFLADPEMTEPGWPPLPTKLVATVTMPSPTMTEVGWPPLPTK